MQAILLSPPELLSQDPSANSLACSNYGAFLVGRGQLEEAIVWYKRAIDYDHGNLIAYYNLSDAYRRCDRLILAAIGYQHVLEMDPYYFRAKYGLCLCFLARFYQSLAQLQEARMSYEQHLNELIEMVGEFDDLQLLEASSAVGLFYPFFLAYQGQNDAKLQKRHGAMIHQLMALRYREYSQPIQMPKKEALERLRVGFVSRYFYDSSVWKIPLGGWVEGLDKKRFESFGYSVSLHEDSSTQLAKEHLDHFFQSHDFEALAERIYRDRLHALIFVDIGMETLSTRLACLRLAPIQCTGLGHPETSGLPTIDYFLSSELMESEGSQEHYSESLIKLSGLSIYYKPYAFEPQKRNWSALGLRMDAVKYLCCQSLCKYLPQHDRVWVEIAKKVPQAQFIFIARPALIASHFQERLASLFQKEGLVASDHLVMLPLVKVEEFADLCATCDLFLDSFEWSGFNTSMEALHRALPVITLPGSLARGRHSSAILKALKIEELIAASFEDYIAIAVRLGLDPQARKQIADRVKEHFPKICADLSSLKSLEAFLEQAVKDRLTNT